MTVYPPDKYLHYSPLPPNPVLFVNYRVCLYKLGFKQEEAEIGVNHSLILDLKAFLEGTEYFYLRKCDNSAAFRTLVLEFLEKHGPRYWGHSQRQHLEEKEPCKGFLYPRDVHRGQSTYFSSAKLLDSQYSNVGCRFLDAVDYLFDYKAKCSQYKDVSSTVDFVLSFN